MPFWGVVIGVVNIIMGVARGHYHQLPVGVAMVPEGSLKKLEPMRLLTPTQTLVVSNCVQKNVQLLLKLHFL